MRKSIEQLKLEIFNSPQEYGAYKEENHVYDLQMTVLENAGSVKEAFDSVGKPSKPEIFDTMFKMIDKIHDKDDKEKAIQNLDNHIEEWTLTPADKFTLISHDKEKYESTLNVKVEDLAEPVIKSRALHDLEGFLGDVVKDKKLIPVFVMEIELYRRDKTSLPPNVQNLVEPYARMYDDLITVNRRDVNDEIDAMNSKPVEREPENSFDYFEEPDEAFEAAHKD